MCVPAQPQIQDADFAASPENEKKKVSWRSGDEEVDICDHPRWINEGEPNYRFVLSSGSVRRGIDSR